MKKTYVEPKAKFINYTYDEQVVAASNKIDGYGDGHQINYCTYRSDSFSDPCKDIVSSEFGASICHVQPWSLRG